MEEQIYMRDLVISMPMRFGVGFGLPSKEIPFPSPNTVWWAGMGGSIVLMDLDNKLSFSYVMNKMNMTMTADLRTARLIMALYAGLRK
jgi:CubicO group peptidase (beta-lactamase class C family)